jgi:RimK family alpha-L-glutamate ligase
VQQFFIAGGLSPTNVRLVEALRNLDTDVALRPVRHVLRQARPGDVVLARLDVRPALDGIEPGIDELEQLEQLGVRVLNRPPALFSAHDKLATAIRLGRALLPHPTTALVSGSPPRWPQTPAVVKPRFGRSGRDVFLCPDADALRRILNHVRNRSWFRRQGALVQSLVPPVGEALRVLIAGRTVVATIRRLAAPGEWRTNVALGARWTPVTPPPEARRLALAASDAIGADFVGVDLLPSDESHTIIAINGCVDLTDEYSLNGTNVFDAIAERLLATADTPRTSGGRGSARPWATRPLRTH